MRQAIWGMRLTDSSWRRQSFGGVNVAIARVALRRSLKTE